MCSARVRFSGPSRCGRSPSTLGTSRMCPYSMGLTLMNTRCGLPCTGAWSSKWDLPRPASSWKAKSTSSCPAFLKLNFLSSKACTTWSTLNSVGRFLVARPSLSCATKPYAPRRRLVSTCSTSYRNSLFFAAWAQPCRATSSNRLFSPWPPKLTGTAASSSLDVLGLAGNPVGTWWSADLGMSGRDRSPKDRTRLASKPPLRRRGACSSGSSEPSSPSGQHLRFDDP
mmetsp:Transcript_25819/g.72307  ORF Transcript_25819/g.72307 Transcript_25819/m.72307 type:complete len:227 (-) Transcript_25819:55-735(-)